MYLRCTLFTYITSVYNNEFSLENDLISIGRKLGTRKIYFFSFSFSCSKAWEECGMKPILWSECLSRQITVHHTPYRTIRVIDLDCISLTSRAINSCYRDNCLEEFTDIYFLNFFYAFEINLQ